MDPVSAGILVAGNAFAGLMSARGADRAGDKAYERSREYTPQHFAEFAYEAQKAGFHPLAALRATGGAQRGAVVAPSPDANLGSVFGEVIADAASLYANRPSESEVEMDNLRRDIMVAELDNIRAETAGYAQGRFGAGIPHATTTSDHGSVRPDGTSVRLFGVDTDPDDRFSDAEVQEERWGDVTSALLGLVTFGADISNTIAAENRKSPLLERQAPPEAFGPGSIFGRIPQALDAWGDRIAEENDRRRDASRQAPRPGNTWAMP